MKDFFKTSSFKVLAIVVVVLLGLIIYTATAGGSLLASMLGFVTSPMQSVSTTATGAVTEFVDLDALSRDELKDMVDSLSQENAELREQLVDYENTLKENEQLKTQLQITEEAPENTLRAATVIGRDPNDVFFGFFIDKGTLAGVKTGDPVITEQGLVGIVSQAYATTSKVSNILSEDVNVSAVVPARGESGRDLQRHHFRQRRAAAVELPFQRYPGAAGGYCHHLRRGRYLSPGYYHRGSAERAEIGERHLLLRSGKAL